MGKGGEEQKRAKRVKEGKKRTQRERERSRRRREEEKDQTTRANVGLLKKGALLRKEGGGRGYSEGGEKERERGPKSRMMGNAK